MRGQIGEMHKGAVFLAELKRRLFLERFTLAIPEPDLGDDLWIVDLNVTDRDDDESGWKPGGREPKLLRCQVKSALPTQNEGGDNVYTVNFTKTSKERLEQEFYYLIGLHDKALANNMFHVACFPSKYFQKLNEGNYLRLTGKDRTMLDFFLSGTENYPKYTLRVKYSPQPGKQRGRGPRADVVEFFIPEECTLRAAFKNCRNWDATIRFAPDTNRRPGPRARRGM